jgi:diacylglycerol kinase family enzyme
MPGIGIIVNPYSRGHRLDPTRADRLGFIVGEKGSCHTTRDLNEVEQLAREFKAYQIDILGISGGDGTNHKTLSTFLKVYGDQPLPKIAFLRGGTMNNLANCLNIRGAPEKILSDLILKYHEDLPFAETELGMIKVNDSFGFLFGMGLVSRFINKYEEHENGDPTPWHAFKLLTRTAASALFQTKTSVDMCERFDAKITVDGKPAPFINYTMILAGTMEELGFNFRPLYRARQETDRFQLVAVSTTPLKLLFTFPQAFLGRTSNSEYYYDIMAREVIIELGEDQHYTIDGDTPEKSNKICISMGPKLKAIIP